MRQSVSRLRSALGPAAGTGLLAVLSLSFTLAGLEIGLRLAGYQPIYAVYSKSSILWRADPWLGWSHQPRSQTVFVGPRPWPIEFSSLVRINSLGLRGPELRPPLPGEMRVLLLGDSMVAGFEVAYEETFGARLEDQLAGAMRRPVQVINAGVRGYGTDQSYLYYRERGHRLDPDLVIHLHTGNDTENNVTLHRMRRPFGKPAFALAADGSLELRKQPTGGYPICSQYRLAPGFEVERLDTALGRLACRSQLVLFDHSALFAVVAARLQQSPGLVSLLYHVGSSAPESREPGPADRGGPDYRTRLTTAILLELARSVRADGAEFLLIADQPGADTLDPESLAAEGIVAHAVTPEGDGASARFRFRRDAHLNAAGHLRLAESLGSLVLAGAPAGRTPLALGSPEGPAGPPTRIARGRPGR